MNVENPEELRSQLDRLQERLATRQSVLHFAHAGVSILVALIFAGAAAKLFWDSARVPLVAFAASGLSLGLLCYGVLNLTKGRRLLAEELKQYNDLLELRRQLRLDNPSALLPR